MRRKTCFSYELEQSMQCVKKVKFCELYTAG